jgi:hypothetical protein
MLAERVCRTLPIALTLAALVALAVRPTYGAPPHMGCGARVYADSCLDACCSWCPAAALAPTTDTANGHSADQILGQEEGRSSAQESDAAARAKGSCHDRGRAPCGHSAITRPASECYIELAIALSSVVGVIALAALACYARHRCTSRRAVANRQTKSPLTPSTDRQQHPLIGIPYAQSTDGTLTYYASPYALAGDVECVPFLDGRDRHGDDARRDCRQCRDRG